MEAWATDHPNGIPGAELQYLKSGDELVYVLPKEKSPLRRIYNKAESMGLGWFRRKPTDAIGFDPETTLLQEDERAEAVLNRVILLIGLLMLVGPLWILEFLKTITHSLAVITCFIILFRFLVSFATAARPFWTAGNGLENCPEARLHAKERVICSQMHINKAGRVETNWCSSK